MNKKIGVFMMVTFLLIGVFVMAIPAHASEFDETYTSELEFLSYSEAREFLAFLYNKNSDELSYEDLSDDLIYLYLCGSLEKGTDEYISAQRSFVTTQAKCVERHIGNSSKMVDQASQALLDSLLDEVGITNASIDAFNTAIDIVLKDVGDCVYDTLGIVLKSYTSAIDVYSKVESIISELNYAVHSLIAIKGNNEKKLYEYYEGYVTLRGGNLDYMENKLDTLSLNNNIFDGFSSLFSKLGFGNHWSDEHIQHAVRTFAEFTYHSICEMESTECRIWDISADSSDAVFAIISNPQYEYGYKLKIVGTGDMKDWSSPYDVPWREYNDEITALTFEDGVTSIGNKAFNELDTLFDVEIGKGVKRIGMSAFNGSDFLKTVTIPAAVKTIEVDAFYDCMLLKEFVVASGNTAFCDVDGVLYSKDKKMLLQYPGGRTDTSFTVPSYVTQIGAYAFADPNISSLTSVTIPSGVTEIGDYAFAYCDKITGITLPSTLKKIGDRAFKGSGLTSIKIPNSVTAIGIGAFENCSKLDNVQLGTGLTEIQNSTFQDCSSLKSVSISKSVKVIGMFAFSNCSSLESIIIPGSVKEISRSVFQNCSSLESITLPFVGEYADGSGNGYFGYIFGAMSSSDHPTVVPSSLTNVVITGGESIICGAFHNCTSIQSLSLPFVGATLNGTENTHFGYIFGSSSYELHYRDIPDSLKSVTITGGTKIDDYAFYRCHNLKNVNLSNTITTVGCCAFRDCDSLESFAFPNGVKMIGFEAIGYCDELKSVTIGSGVEVIEAPAFSGCSSLTTINVASDNSTFYSQGNCIMETETQTVVAGCVNSTIPADTLHIGDNSFSNCLVLEGITIPEGVLSIGNFAFRRCIVLAEITIPASVQIIGEGAFGYCEKMNRVTVVSGSQLTKTKERVFEGCVNLESMTIPFVGASLDGTENTHFGYLFGATSYVDQAEIVPDSLTDVDIIGGKTVWDHAFEGLVQLRRIGFCNGVTSIGAHAFSGCTALWGVSLPITLTDIGAYAFRRCYNLDSIAIPNSVITIGEYAFSQCRTLNSVFIAIGEESQMQLQHLGFAVFDGCSSLSIIENLPFVGADLNGTENTHFGYVFGAKDAETQGDYIPENITIVDVIGGRLSESAFLNCAAIEQIWLSYVTEIERNAFVGCSALNKITIGTGVEKISGSAFSGLENLQDLSVLEGNPIYYSSQNCIIETATKTLTNGCNYSVIPTDGSVLHIGSSAFSGCGNLTSVVLPENLISIGAYAFRRSGITAVEIPNSVTTIGEGAFGYTNLTKVAFERNSQLQKIENIAFQNCGKLEHVVFPASLTAIGANVFEGCNSLKDIVSYSTWKQWNVLAKGDLWDGGIEYKLYVIGDLKFSNASITLSDDLMLNYKVNASLFAGQYKNPYVKFVMNGQEIIVRNYTVESGKYVFKFSNIAPHKMNDTVYATLYAEFDGLEFNSVTVEYSVATYCYNMLEKCSGNEYMSLRRLLVDLLDYGSQSQIYVGYRTDALANEKLTETQKKWGTADERILQTKQHTKYKMIENPTVTWKSAGLKLEDSVAMRFKLATADISGLVVKVTDAYGNEWNITSDQFKETTDGCYYVYFDKFNADQMSDVVYLTVYEGNVAVSHTIRYSIESYAYSKQNDTNEALAELVKAMMQYGDSAYAYVHSTTDGIDDIGQSGDDIFDGYWTPWI